MYIATMTTFFQSQLFAAACIAICSHRFHIVKSAVIVYVVFFAGFAIFQFILYGWLVGFLLVSVMGSLSVLLLDNAERISMAISAAEEALLVQPEIQATNKI